LEFLGFVRDLECMGYCAGAFWELREGLEWNGQERGSTNRCYNVLLHSYLTLNETLDEP
jgi:hypothetical protein